MAYLGITKFKCFFICDLNCTAFPTGIELRASGLTGLTLSVQELRRRPAPRLGTARCRERCRIPLSSCGRAALPAPCPEEEQPLPLTARRPGAIPSPPPPLPRDERLRPLPGSRAPLPAGSWSSGRALGTHSRPLPAQGSGSRGGELQRELEEFVHLCPGGVGLQHFSSKDSVQDCSPEQDLLLPWCSQTFMTIERQRMQEISDRHSQRPEELNMNRLGVARRYTGAK
ncbi:uncharacterized protein LOC121339549 [Onychostruthus taczanowskii]|uniref:uncharacterized protein LOC121339549 n=1 Tax=Onychostruthus taczanowskii TaxID=356909 RepID=UPI001B807C7A|nr:uncharacterized protein LOC121339549 [Onychostruthus taczanowskii]